MWKNTPQQDAAGPAGPWWRDEPPSRWHLAFPGVFLLYLVDTASGVNEYSHGTAAAAGYGMLVAFCACYLFILATVFIGPAMAVRRQDPAQERRRFWLCYAAMIALWAAELPLARSSASVMCVFIAVLTIGAWGPRGAPAVAALAALAAFLPPLLFSHAAVDTGDAAAIAMASIAMCGFFGLIRQHQALKAARAEVVRLAADNERNRIARDLHDLLGHSLTTITVKAGLARRLGEKDPGAALQEITEVEALSRRALADVRAAVSSYRELTLGGELATAHELLRAAGIDATLPPAADVAAPAYHELFAWVLREAMTNVVRHARASSCSVELTATAIEITDNGQGAGSAAGGGNGLRGLHERVQGAGGRLEAGPRAAGGWRIRVDMPDRVAGTAPCPSLPEPAASAGAFRALPLASR